MRLGAYLDQRPPLFTTAFAMALVVGVAIADYATGPEIGLSLFYVAPILLVTHRSGKWPGIALSVFAVMAWLGADLMASRTYSITLIHYWNATIRLALFVVILLLVVALKRERLSARQDVLTGAGNRQVLHEMLSTEIARAQRFQRPLSCALIDVDRFKSINDSLGHQEGDHVLRSIADTLRQHTRTIDVVTRFGGDEFVVLLPETGAAAAAAVMRRIQKGLDVPLVTLSIGIVTFERPPQSGDEVLNRADAALYAAKHVGGNTIEHDIIESRAS